VSRESAANAAVRRARRKLRRESFGSIRVAACFHYGAVDIDPRHLVVWVLLRGEIDEKLPEWFFLDNYQDDPKQSRRLGPDLVEWLERLRACIRREFQQRGWPRAEDIHVGFDSEDRVADGGGFHYFM
jgi:hypothetical protein